MTGSLTCDRCGRDLRPSLPCPTCGRKAAKNFRDRIIGSLLEAWLTEDIGPFCQFCREEKRRDGEKTCSPECQENLDTVREARIAIGQRDLDQRGYD